MKPFSLVPLSMLYLAVAACVAGSRKPSGEKIVESRYLNPPITIEAGEGRVPFKVLIRAPVAWENPDENRLAIALNNEVEFRQQMRSQLRAHFLRYPLGPIRGRAMGGEVSYLAVPAGMKKSIVDATALDLPAQALDKDLCLENLKYLRGKFPSCEVPWATPGKEASFVREVIHAGQKYQFSFMSNEKRWKIVASPWPKDPALFLGLLRQLPDTL